jgi:hypothetical protein
MANPTLRQLIDLAKYFTISLDWLVAGEPQMEKVQTANRRDLETELAKEQAKSRHMQEVINSLRDHVAVYKQLSEVLTGKRESTKGGIRKQP